MRLASPVEMIEEVRHGVFATGEHSGRPTLAEVVKAIQRMDGKTRSLISLNLDDDSVVMIGGSAGSYVFTLDHDSYILNILSAEEESDECITLVAGGQAGDYPAHYVVGFDTVTEVLNAVFSSQPLPEHVKFELISKHHA